MYALVIYFYTMNSILYTTLSSPLGNLVACASAKGLSMLEFADCADLDLELSQLAQSCKKPLVEGVNQHIEQAHNQLQEYFCSKRYDFSIPLDLVGTEFQKKVWLSLLRIPYGHTISYAAQAESIQKPTAVRAVANANGKNKISIILPCHRVVGSNGTLTGYGGGLWRKKFLLDLEKIAMQ